MGRNADIEEFFKPRLHFFNFFFSFMRPIFLLWFVHKLFILHSNCFPNHRIRLERSASISLLGFPAMNTKRISQGSCQNLFPSPIPLPGWGHWSCQHWWRCRPGQCRTVCFPLALSRLLFSRTSIVRTHVSSLGKTWCLTFVQSQQNERKRRKSPTPTPFCNSALYAKPVCTVQLGTDALLLFLT